MFNSAFSLLGVNQNGLIFNWYFTNLSRLSKSGSFCPFQVIAWFLISISLTSGNQMVSMRGFSLLNPSFNLHLLNVWARECIT